MKKYLKEKIYKLYKNEITISEFEAWIYKESIKLEEDHQPELYFELISFNYKSKFAKQEFFNLFDQFINWGEYETWRINKILDSIINKDSDFYENLLETYELSCYGYQFFEELGMRHGLNLYSETNYGAQDWYKKDEKTRKRIIDSYHKNALNSALQVKNWVNSGKIVLTGKIDLEYNRHTYIDNRNEEELSEDEKVYIKRNENKQQKPKQAKRWWPFWNK